jgi:hypothetical protein
MKIYPASRPATKDLLTRVWNKGIIRGNLKEHRNHKMWPRPISYPQFLRPRLYNLLSMCGDTFEPSLLVPTGERRRLGGIH